MGLRLVVAGVGAAGLIGAGLIGVNGAGGHRPGLDAVTAVLGGADTKLPAAPSSALHVGRPQLLDARDASIWAPVLRLTDAEAAAGSNTTVEPVATRTPEGTTNVVRVLRDRVVAGSTWSEVALPSTGAARTGWLPRSALGAFHIVDTRLDIDLTRLTLTLRVAGATALRLPIGVGRRETPTPVGEFYVRDKLTRYHSPFYGPLAFGTSARSAVLTEWPAGGYIGIHGTDEPGLIPGRISHGCIRLRNADLLRLAGLLQVGTPISIHGS
jgi:lipoprotein-anchoring transpeptidase ErfK/SrfK